MPAAADIHSVPQSWKERRPDINEDFAGIYPWDWVRDDVKAFRALSGESKDALLVAPIIQTLILNRNPVETLDWVDAVCKWDFRRVVPAHLKNNIEAGPSSFRRAFSFLTVEGEPAGQPKPRRDDLQTLLDAEKSWNMGATLPNQVGLETIGPRSLRATSPVSRGLLRAEAGHGRLTARLRRVDGVSVSLQ